MRLWGSMEQQLRGPPAFSADALALFLLTRSFWPKRAIGRTLLVALAGLLAIFLASFPIAVEPKLLLLYTVYVGLWSNSVVSNSDGRGTSRAAERCEAGSGSQLESAHKDYDFRSSRIETRPNPGCYLCGSLGSILYEHLQDKLYHAPGDWNLKVCPKPECGLIWLDPIPLEDEIGKAYTTYYTHADWTTTRGTWPSRLLRKGSSVFFAALDPLRRERRRLSLMFVGDSKPGKLLDVGCGNGTRLAELKSLGWDVYGQDVDPQAVRYAQETFGLKVNLGRLEDIRFPEQFFDCITLNHVIEHVHDPIGLLKECRRILRTGGLMVVVTPNSKSFAHAHFGRFWRGLEPPRHIHLFSPKTLSKAAVRAGFTVSCASTTVANGETFGYGSLLIRDSNTIPSKLRHKIVRKIRVRGFYYRSIVEHLRDADSGEECVLRATSPV